MHYLNQTEQVMHRQQGTDTKASCKIIVPGTHDKGSAKVVAATSLSGAAVEPYVSVGDSNSDKTHPKYQTCIGRHTKDKCKGRTTP